MSSIGQVGWNCCILDQAVAQVTHTDDGLALAAVNCKNLQPIMVFVPRIIGLKGKVTSALSCVSPVLGLTFCCKQRSPFMTISGTRAMEDKNHVSVTVASPRQPVCHLRRLQDTFRLPSISSQASLQPQVVSVCYSRSLSEPLCRSCQLLRSRIYSRSPLQSKSYSCV